MLPIDTESVLIGYKEPLTKVTDGFGFYGTIAYDKTEKYTQCHICGFFLENLGLHVRSKHDKGSREYKEAFGLPITLSLKGPKAKSHQWETWQQLDPNKREAILSQLKEARSHAMPARIAKKSLYVKNLEGRCPEQLLDKIITQKAKLGHVPSSTEFVKEYGSGFLGSIRLTFGTWSEALKILGLAPQRSGGEREYDKDSLLELLRNFSKSKGREPMSSDTIGLLPSRQTFTRHFGSFTNAKKEAGVMIIDRYDQVATLEVWAPRYHDKRVLVACYKVDRLKTDHIKIVFPKASSLEGNWYISRKVVRRFPKQSNGTISCYAVPLHKLEPLQVTERSRYE